MISQPDETYIVYGTAAPNAVVESFLAHPAGDTLRPADTSGHGEAREYIRQTRVSPTGEFIFSSMVTHFIVLTCTATDTDGNTSEMSANFILVPEPMIIVAYVYTPEKSEQLPQNGVNIIVVDPNSDTVGMDSLNNLINQIPGAEYHETPNDSVVIPHPVLGSYEIIIGGETGGATGSCYAAIIKTDGLAECVITVDAEVPESGVSTSSSYTFDEGFLYTNGDSNGDETCNVPDAVYIISYIFKGGPPPVPEAAGDADCNNRVNVADAVYLIDYIFRGGDPPCFFEP